jgi:hypothetical protein
VRLCMELECAYHSIPLKGIPVWGVYAGAYPQTKRLDTETQDM